MQGHLERSGVKLVNYKLWLTDGAKGCRFAFSGPSAPTPVNCKVAGVLGTQSLEFTDFVGRWAPKLYNSKGSGASPEKTL